MSIIYNSGVSLTGVSAARTTGTAADLLAGATAITAVTGEQELITGTMANVGAINVTYTISSVGGSYTYTFPNNIYTTGGTITVNENIPTKSAQTYYISSSDQIISAGLFLTGDQTIAAVDPLYTTNYMPTTYNMTIPSGKYLLGDQTIYGDPHLISSNIRSGVSIFGVWGSIVDYYSQQVNY